MSSSAVRRKLGSAAAPRLALALAAACACFACDPSFNPDWHAAPTSDAAEPLGDAAQEPADAGSSEASVLPEEDAGGDAGETRMRLYECMIPQVCAGADASAEICANKCFASTRDVMCVVAEEPCPYTGYTVVECKLCNGPPIK